MATITFSLFLSFGSIVFGSIVAVVIATIITAMIMADRKKTMRDRFEATFNCPYPETEEMWCKEFLTVSAKLLDLRVSLENAIARRKDLDLVLHEMVKVRQQSSEDIARRDQTWKEFQSIDIDRLKSDYDKVCALARSAGFACAISFAEIALDKVATPTSV